MEGTSSLDGKVEEGLFCGKKISRDVSSVFVVAPKREKLEAWRTNCFSSPHLSVSEGEGKQDLIFA